MKEKMSQAFYPTNDGHIGNIAKLTTQELTELIHRQTALLQKRSFIQKLPDKGKKIQDVLEVLNKEAQQRQTQTVVTARSKGNKQESDTQLDADSELFYKEFDKLSVKNSEVIAEEKNKHLYEIAEERAKQHEHDLKKHVRLNQNLKAVHVEDLPMDIISTKPMKTKTSKIVPVVPEETAATPPTYKYNEAQVIPLQESLHLQREQKEKVDEMQTKAAAQRLTQRLGIKMERYNPEGVDMSYRGLRAELDSDSDEDNRNENIYDEGDDVD